MPSFRVGVVGDFLPPDIRWIKGYDPAGRDLVFLQSFWVATNPRILFPHFPLSESGNYHWITTGELIFDNFDDLLYLEASFLVRQSEPYFNRSNDVGLYHLVPLKDDTLRNTMIYLEARLCEEG